jgi:hypothetical protein
MFDTSEVHLNAFDTLNNPANPTGINSVDLLSQDLSSFGSKQLLISAGEIVINAWQHQTNPNEAVVYGTMSIFNENFASNAQIAFGKDFNIATASDLGVEILGGNLGVSPNVQFLFDDEMNGASGAYSQSTNTIYLNRSFVAENADNPTAVGKVLVEEMGHFLDAYASPIDSPGDEGDIIARLANQEALDTATLFDLKSEDDTGFITVSGDLLPVEFSSSNWRVELYNNISRTGTPVVIQDWGNGSQGFSRDWGNGSPHWAINSDNFSLRATTQRYFAPGRHEIRTTSDDGVKVNIAGQTIIDRLVDQATVTNTGIFDAGNGGTFTTIVDYYERGGGANLTFTTRSLQQSVSSLVLNQPAQSGQLSTSDRNNPTRSGKYSDDYRLVGLTAGQQVRLRMNSSFDTFLQLINESTGQVITENDDFNGTNSQITFTPQAGISYIARATSYSSGITGSYSVELTSLAPPVSVSSLVLNQPAQSGQLSTSDRNNPTRSGKYSDDYRLVGLTAGQQVRLQMNSSFDTFLQLINESTGQVITENDDFNGTNSQITFTPQAGISYIARATSYSSGITGSYDIIASSVSPPGLSATTTNLTRLINGELNGDYIEADYNEYLHQCVDLVKDMTDTENISTSNWRRGENVIQNRSVAVGTAVAIFDSAGSYNHRHTAIFAGYDTVNGAFGFWAWSQNFPTGSGVRRHFIPVNGSASGNNDADEYYVIRPLR